jgi:alanyl-tRNA synthetase
MSPDELAAVESMANAYVLRNSPVETRLMALEDARETGARALFGEKYGEEVRVVSMGEPEGAGASGSDTKGKANKAWSVELCGGTHVARTGDIGLIRVTAEAASAAGVRRIEALTAQGAHDYLAQQDQRVRELAGALRTKPEDVVERVKALIEERRQMERELANAKRQLALSGSAAGNGAAAKPESAVRTVGKVKLMARSVQGLNPKDLRGLIDDGKKQVGSGIVAIVGVTEDGKAGLAVGVTEDLTQTYNAVDLVKVGAAALGGKGGGGRPDMAQAGGPDGSKAQAALEAIEAQLAG